jgi:hypothetical protein
MLLARPAARASGSSKGSASSDECCSYDGCAAVMQDARQRVNFLQSLVATFGVTPEAQSASLLEELLRWNDAPGDGAGQLLCPLVANGIAQLLDSLAMLVVQQVGLPVCALATLADASQILYTH